MHRRAWAIAVLVIVIAAAAAAVVLADGDRPAVHVDERRGVLEGVAFGDDVGRVRSLRGEPSDDDPGFFPSGSDYTGPPGIPIPAADGRVAPTELHYGTTAYLVSATAGVFSMATLDDAAETRAGVGVGDDLELVRKRYHRVTCGESVAGESLVGGDTPMYGWCRAIVGNVRVFFGEDPIESITLTKRG
jgi:hypothetical protein